MARGYATAGALAALAAGVAASLQPPVVTTSYGPVAGTTTPSGAWAYLSVPYAAPPQRFGPPVPPTPWTTPLNATVQRPACIQLSGANASQFAEDCLFVSVYSPGPTQQAPGRPGIIWIHGGGFVTGSSSGDFSAYALSTGAVIFSVEYRLGSIGFLALPGFAPAYPTPTDPSVGVANAGLLDQQTALLWVKANAAAFGVDPANILLTGQSAGGTSVMFHLTLPGSYPAYKAAIPQSPGSPVNLLADSQATSTAIAQKLGCPAGAGGVAAQLACLRAVPVQQVVDAALAVAGTGMLPLTLGPTMDGALVQAAPATAMLAGNFNTAAHIVVTEALFEGDSLLNGFTHGVVLTPAQAAAALTQFGVQVGWNATRDALLAELYAPITARDGYWNGSSRLWGDGLIACASAWAAIGAAKYSQHPVHRLLFNTTMPGQPAGRATHGSDLPFFFGYNLATPQEQAVSADLHGWEVNLAVTGDVNNGPRGAGPLPWPAFSPATPGSLMVVNEQRQYSFIDSWQEEFCDTWLSVLP